MVNAAKHGAGQSIDLRLDYLADRVRLTVANRIAAAGQKTQAPAMQTADAGYGLAGMRERLLLIGGSLHAGPHEGRWIVTAELPNVPTPAGPTTEGRAGEQ
jgi:signal transduction histidine kinase